MTSHRLIKRDLFSFTVNLVLRKRYKSLCTEVKIKFCSLFLLFNILILMPLGKNLILLSCHM